MFHSNIISIYGEKGKAWLDELPKLVSATSSKLDLRDLQEVTNLTYNYVLSRTGSPRFARDDELLNYLQKAKKLRDQLLQTSEADVLLHGDLHHDNILQNSDEWLVSDPKGVIGESAYEVAAFIRNPMPELIDLFRN